MNDHSRPPNHHRGIIYRLRIIYRLWIINHSAIAIPVVPIIIIISASPPFPAIIVSAVPSLVAVSAISVFIPSPVPAVTVVVPVIIPYRICTGGHSDIILLANGSLTHRVRARKGNDPDAKRSKKELFHT